MVQEVLAHRSSSFRGETTRELAHGNRGNEKEKEKNVEKKKTRKEEGKKRREKSSYSPRAARWGERRKYSIHPAGNGINSVEKWWEGDSGRRRSKIVADNSRMADTMDEVQKYKGRG